MLKSLASYGNQLGALGFAHKKEVAPSSDWWLAGSINTSLCAGAYQFKGASSKDASRTNLNNPSVSDINSLGTLDWNSTDGIINTEITGATNLATLAGTINKYTQGFSYFFRASDMSAGTVNGAITWFRFASGAYSVAQLLTSGSMQIMNYGTAYTFPTPVVSGIYGMAGNTVYFNGSPITTTTSGSFTGAYVSSGLLSTSANTNRANGKMQACSFYNTVLTDAQVLALSNAMALL